LAEKFSNLLIIGREHMKNWPDIPQFLDNHRDRISFFFADNKANDDAFILMAAMRHPKTLILTRDMFQNVKRALIYRSSINNEEVKDDFDRWLVNHRVYITASNEYIFPRSLNTLSCE